MKFFVDTAKIEEIEEAESWGVLAGVTTNPTLYLRAGGKLADFHDHLARICDIVDGPVSGETTSDDRDEIVAQGRELAQIADNLVVKVATTPDGLAATKVLAEEGIAVNMTLCFTVPQALLASRAGASYVSPFIGRFDDISEDGLEHLENVIVALRNYDFGHEVEVITASVRHPHHVVAAAMMGADIATVPFEVLKKLVKHPLTDRGLQAILEDWEKVKNS